MRLLSRALSCIALVLASACSSLPVVGRSAPERWGFHAPWDARSAASVRTHGAALDGVVLDWIALDSLTGLPLDLYRDSLSATLAPTVRRMAIVTSFITDRFHPELIRRLAVDSIALKRSAAAIADRMQRGGYRGVVLDFEDMTGLDTALTRAVVATMASVARSRGVGPVVVALPASDTVGYPARLFASSADLLLIMLYDQHWETSPPGAIAEPAWVRRTLAMRVAESGSNRMVAALPLYGYLWRPNVAATPISYDDARRLAAESAVSLDRDPATQTLHAARTVGDQWELWVSDAVLLDALQREVAALNVTRVAYWRLGLEDAAFWTLIGR
jgi:peptidoglycan-N-acetylglucosamine deacetylase